MRITNEFRNALRKFPKPLYLLGQEAGFHPARISQLIHGREVKRTHDIRFKLLAKQVGYRGRLFEPENIEEVSS